jgi:O-antigen ligase
LVPLLVLAVAAYVGLQPSTRWLGLAVGALGFVLLLRYPGLSLVTLAALSFTVPFTFSTGTAVSLTPPVFLIVAVALVWLLDGVRRRSLRLPASRAVLPLMLFLLAGLLSLLAGRAYWDPLVPQSGNLLLVQLAQWGLFALSATIFIVAGDLGARGRWLQMATWVFLILGTVVVLGFYLPPVRRILGWSSPEMASRSMFWTWLTALAGGQLLFNRRLVIWVRLWLLALLLAAAYVLWFRLNDWISGWAPFAVAVGTVVLLWLWRRSRVAAFVLALALVVLAVVLYPAVFAHAGGEQELELSWGGRLLLYEATLDLVKDHPLLGLGPAAYRHYGYTRWLGMGAGEALWVRPRVASHNNYIDVYAQGGLVGLGLFLWFLVEVGLLGWRLRSRFSNGFNVGYVHGALAGMVATLAAMMLADWFLPFVYNIGFTGFRTSALAWMFLGGLVALEQVVGGRQTSGEDTA